MRRIFPLDRRIIPGLIVLFAAWILAGLFVGSGTLHYLFLFALGFHLYFFRDPIRKCRDLGGPVSSADGKVVEIARVFEDRYLKGDAIKIGIFLSVFDVHVNRSPEAGEVEYLDYVPGKFLNALKEDSVKYNESNWVGLLCGGRRILVRQIAGVIARRIHCDVTQGMKIGRGDKIGMICYGSRVEIFMPQNQFLPSVKIGQRVKVGETLLGRWG
jgi:phosphatidylserine decarboxylase